MVTLTDEAAALRANPSGSLFQMLPKVLGQNP